MRYYIELITKQHKEKIDKNLMDYFISTIGLILLSFTFPYLISNFTLKGTYFIVLTTCIIGFTIMFGLFIYTLIKLIKSISKYKKVIKKLNKEKL